MVSCVYRLYTATEAMPEEKWDKSGTFIDQISVHIGLASPGVIRILETMCRLRKFFSSIISQQLRCQICVLSLSD